MSNPNDWLKKIEKAERRFWQTDYPRMSFEERLTHWATTLGRGMRSEQKAGRDPYGIYTPEWRQSIRELEPEFDRIMERLFQTEWKDVWEEKEYRQRIG